jgi:hypothetical protein
MLDGLRASGALWVFERNGLPVNEIEARSKIV